MATQKILLGNLKGPKGDSYILTDSDKEQIANEVQAALKTESWTFTLEDGSTITKKIPIEG